MPLKLPTAEQFLFAANIIADKLLFKQQHDASVNNILIVKWDEIGDMATATHVFKMVRENYPDASITLLCKPFVKSLIATDPNISDIITDINEFHKSYDLVIEMRGTWQTLFKSIWFKAKYRVSRAEVRARNKGRQLHEIDTNTAIVQPILKNDVAHATPELYYSVEDGNVVKDFLDKNNIRRFAVFHVGARRVLRQWPLERFALIAEYLHRQFQLEIIFAGTLEDDVQINTVRDDLNFETYAFTKGFSLSQFSCLCSKASFYIGNESGPLHIAAVFNVPLIGIFGPGVPDVFYPRSAYSKVVHHVLKCNPCNQIDCVEPQNPCINRVTIVEIMDAINVINETINLKV